MAPLEVWVSYFIGTPQRMMRTIIGVSLIVVLIKPELLERAVSALMVAVQPLIAPALTILIVFAGLRIMFHGFNQRKGGSK